MKVSIIIPSYNSYQFISQTLVSVFDQTHSNFEVIVVDDGSTDKTLEIIQRYKDRIQIIPQENRGACAARNKGFELSKGQYIQFLDADDLLSANKIESQIKILLDQTDVIANGSWGRFYSNEPFNEDIQWGPDLSIQKDLDPVSWLCQNHMSQTACWLTPRHLIEKAGGWDESLTQNQDGEFFTRVISNAKKVIYTPEAKVYYRSNLSESISKNARKRKNIESRFQACQSYEQVILNLEDSVRTRRAVANKYQHFIYSAYPYHPEIIKKAEERVKIYGGSTLSPYKGGKFHNLLMQTLGWKFPAKLKSIIN